MSIENHPNLHTPGLIVDVYSAVEQRIRGKALVHKQMIMSSPRLSRMIGDFVHDLENSVDELVEKLDGC